MAKSATAPPKAVRSPWLQYAPMSLAVLVMIFAGWKQGVWSERWGTSPELALFTQQLEQVPREFGEWTSVDLEADPRELKIAGAEGEMFRRYKNASGEQVAVSMIVARYQDIFQHSPDRCYPAAGFEMQGEPVHEVFDIGDSKYEFFTTSFLKSEPTGVHRERGYWSYSGDGAWKAPKDPKVVFGGQQWALYKLYVFSSSAGPADRNAQERDYCQDFIRDFMPVLQAKLRPVFVETGRIKSDRSADTEGTAVQPVL